MNSDQLKGNWKQFVGKAKEQWGKLTDDDWKVAEGRRDQLVGRIQERYGIARQEAERQVADFEKMHEICRPSVPPPAAAATISRVAGAGPGCYMARPRRRPEFQ